MIHRQRLCSQRLQGCPFNRCSIFFNTDILPHTSFCSISQYNTVYNNHIRSLWNVHYRFPTLQTTLAAGLWACSAVTAVRVKLLYTLFGGSDMVFCNWLGHFVVSCQFKLHLRTLPSDTVWESIAESAKKISFAKSMTNGVLQMADRNEGLIFWVNTCATPKLSRHCIFISLSLPQ